MRIRLFFFSQMLVCVAMVAYSAFASVTVDFRYGLQDGANDSNGALLKIQIEQNGEIEEVFAGETVGIGQWSPPQSVDITSRASQDFTLIWVVDPIGDIGWDWLVVEDPWVVVAGVKKYSFFDNYDDAEYTTVDVGGEVFSHGKGEEGRDKMWEDAGCVFARLPWSKEHGAAGIPDAVEGVPCERTIFYHPPQKGPTNAGTGAVRFEFTASSFDVASKGKLTTTWGALKSR